MFQNTNESCHNEQCGMTQDMNAPYHMEACVTTQIHMRASCNVSHGYFEESHANVSCDSTQQLTDLFVTVL